MKKTCVLDISSDRVDVVTEEREIYCHSSYVFITDRVEFPVWYHEAALIYLF